MLFRWVCLGHAASTIEFARRSYEFDAQAASTTLTFTQSDGDIWSPKLDNVTVSLIPEPATLSLLGLGAIALIRRRRRS